MGNSADHVEFHFICALGSTRKRREDEARSQVVVGSVFGINFGGTNHNVGSSKEKVSVVAGRRICIAGI
jgi:hypothetical protein